MIGEQVSEQPVRPSRISWRSVAVLAALGVLPGAAYVAAVLLPYYAGDLDTLPLADLASGAHDPEQFRLLAYISVFLTPLGALLALGGCVVQLLAAFPRQEQRVSPGVAAGLGVVGVASLAAILFFLSPLGSALTTWQLD